jgi:hypothetical protein
MSYVKIQQPCAVKWVQLDHGRSGPTSEKPCHCAVVKTPPTLKSVFTPLPSGVFFAYMDVGTSRSAWMRESDARKGRRYIAKRMEKVRLRSGREAGLGHARERCAEGTVTQGIFGNCALYCSTSCFHAAVSSCGTRTSLYITVTTAPVRPCTSRSSHVFISGLLLLLCAILSFCSAGPGCADSLKCKFREDIQQAIVFYEIIYL